MTGEGDRASITAGRWRGAAAGGRERGSVTAELAVALPAVVLVVAALLVTVSAGGTQLRADEAARTAARLAAFGASDAEVRAAAVQLLPGATVDIAHEAPWVEVRVAAGAAGGWLTSGPLEVRAAATAWQEP
ncbi:pilus assembly protein TadE [Actinotalea sp. M2MS4P-6]|uniref:TadE family type IV pilus minor pilin n=1 Tax=Actinotalea sp. M2MS4P-6 TaxID=2983762 RepID=UPI0021E3A512|nr:TadE family type IV pilus minor pilin [Actinotalea sp. M2MS4P-6]MCV2394903.1 pilus assembly protein TadE [Actinotalea sp. M2MS4P-6]